VHRPAGRRVGAAWPGAPASLEPKQRESTPQLRQKSDY
jgi:hypothetical protein